MQRNTAETSTLRAPAATADASSSMIYQIVTITAALLLVVSAAVIW